MPTEEALFDPAHRPPPPDFSGQVLPPTGPTIFRRILEYPPLYVPPAVSLDPHYTGVGDIGDGYLDGDRPTSPAVAVGGPPLGPGEQTATHSAEAATSTYDDISLPGSPGQCPMDTLPPVTVQQDPPPPSPPAVEKRSVSVGTDVDLELLYTLKIAPGILPATLPWGLTINDIVQTLLDHPTLHVDDILREMLRHPFYPGTTMREFQTLSTIARMAQDVLKKVGQQCVTSMLPVRLIQDRNDTTRVQVEDSITGMLGAEAARTDVFTLVDMARLRGPFNPPIVDLTTDDDNPPAPPQ